MKTLFIIGALAAGTLLTASAVNARSKTESSPYRGMKLVWSDEFSGNELDKDKWVILNDYAHITKPHLYFRNHPDNVRLVDGVLVLEARYSNIPNPQKGRAWKESLKDDIRFTQDTIPITSGRIQTADKHKVRASWKYGRIDVRARLSPVKGTHSAIWTMGEHYFDVNWPRGGEIDILEHLGRQPASAWNVIHRGDEEGKDQAVNNGGKEPFNGKSIADGGFHTFSIQWDERKITWYCDGKKTYSYKTSEADVEFEVGGKQYGNPFDMKHFLILDLVVGGWGGEWNPADLPARMEIDWVRVYQEE